MPSVLIILESSEKEQDNLAENDEFVNILEKLEDLRIPEIEHQIIDFDSEEPLYDLINKHENTADEDGEQFKELSDGSIGELWKIMIGTEPYQWEKTLTWMTDINDGQRYHGENYLDILPKEGVMEID